MPALPCGPGRDALPAGACELCFSIALTHGLPGQSVCLQGLEPRHKHFSSSRLSRSGTAPRPPSIGADASRLPGPGGLVTPAEILLLFPDWVMCFILFLLDLLSIM